MKITRYPLNTHSVPVDFRADPDGEWEYDDLVEAAGFSCDEEGIRIGALVRGFMGHPEGAAVVSALDGTKMAGRYFAIVECGVEAAAVVPLVHVFPMFVHTLPRVDAAVADAGISPRAA